MRHVPFFRWVLTLGCVFFVCSVGLYAVGSELSDARQIDLAVVEEKPDGSCRVRWFDPYQKEAREAPYHCDPDRSSTLKAPQFADSRGYGWETGFMRTEGPDRGNLEDIAEADLGSPDVFLLLGVVLISLGLIGGNLRALPRAAGVEARLVRRAARLCASAQWAAEDYERAVAAAEEAGRHGALSHTPDGVPDARLVTALWVLREAGPKAHETALLGRKLAKQMHGLLDDAAPAARLRNMLKAGPTARLNAAQAVTELRLLLADDKRNGLPERFAQTSVDLLRGQDADQAALAAETDFARDPEAYHLLLAQLTGPELSDLSQTVPSGRGRRWHRRR